jgi:hypothetical protein
MTVSRALPSRRIPWWRMTPSFFAPSAAVALPGGNGGIRCATPPPRTQGVEGVAEEQQLAARVDVALLPALGVPRVADLDAVDGALMS